MPEAPNEKLYHTSPVDPPAAVAPCDYDYAELDVVTNFSFLQGASHPDELVNTAATLGCRAIAVTDINTLAGVVRAFEAARKIAGFKLIVGCRLTFTDGTPDLLVWPTDRDAYARLATLLTIGRRRAPKGECHLNRRDLFEHSEGLLAAVCSLSPVLRGEGRGEGLNEEGRGKANTERRTSNVERRSQSTPGTVHPGRVGGRNASVAQTLSEHQGDRNRFNSHATRVHSTPRDLTSTFRCSTFDVRHQQPPPIRPSPRPSPLSTGEREPLFDLHAHFGDRLSLAVSLTCGDDDETLLSGFMSLSEQTGIPLVATNHVHYHHPDRRRLQDVLTCVRHGCTIHDAGFRLFPNAERYLKSPAQMHRLFARCPDAIRRGLEIASRCTFTLDQLKYEYPTEVVPPGMSPGDYLREQTYLGAAKRYPHGVPDRVTALIEKELAFICGSQYESYFLTVYDLVRYARSRGILCQGRGSAANSAVCYCLGVTAVDPAKFQLVFERFASSARAEPPDIDIDFEHERREEVIQYVYEKYGRDRAAMTASLITYRGRSAVRDVGKALGLSQDALDELAGKLDWWHRGTLTPDQLREAGVAPDDPVVLQLVELTGQLLGFPRHLSQHVGGMVISRTPLSQLVPIENAAMEDRTVIEWDKDDLDVLKLFKVDLLALGMLTCLSKAMAMINAESSEHRTSNTEHRTSNERHAGCCAPGSHGNRSGLDDSGTMPHKQSTRCDFERDPGAQHPACLSFDVRCSVFDVRCSLSTSPDVRPLTPALSPAYRGEGAIAAPPRCGTSHAFRHQPLELHTIPQDDPAVYDMISHPDTIGVFQVESRAQMSMLPRLRPEKFYDLVIEVAIVRPGPIQGDMVHPYLQRRERLRNDPTYQVEYPSAELAEVLSATLGVPLFQEQAMRVAVVAAGFTPDEADALRRAMAAWKRGGGLGHFHDKFVNGMIGRGYEPDFAERCFHQICGFGEYGFPESHAASFAILVYASAWIKRYHPAAFAAALLNSQPLGFYAPAQLIRDAREHGVEVRPVDVNASEWDCTLEPPSPLYSGERAGVRGRTSEVVDSEHRTSNTEHRTSNETHAGCCAPGSRGSGNGLDPSDAATRTQFATGAHCDPERDPGAQHPASPSFDVRCSMFDVRCSHSSTPAVRPLTPALAPEYRGATFGVGGPAVRLGFRQVKGMRLADAQRIVEVRQHRGPFDSVEQFHRRTNLGGGAIRRLAEADALTSLATTRRQASWDALAIADDDMPLFADAAGRSVPAALPAMSMGEEVLTDYITVGLSLKRHPVSFARDALKRLRVVPAIELQDAKKFPHGQRVSVAGLVLVRQRPGTASGVVFITLEDETGVANLILWSRIYDRYRTAARHASLLQVEGVVQREGLVVHVLAKRLFDRTHLVHGMVQPSRDFH